MPTKKKESEILPTGEQVDEDESADSRNTSVRFFDLSVKITENVTVYPGDPSYSVNKVASLESGSPFNLYHMHLCNHVGTHIDFPAHVRSEGKTSSDYSIEHLIGSGLIIEVPNSERSITKDFVSQQPILKSDIVFFKTANSHLSKHARFTNEYIYIEPDAAEELLRQGVKIVGIDYISVDKYDAKSLPVHNILLSHGVLIVEGLELNKVPLGRCEVLIMPLNVPDMDGLPARVVAKF